MVAGSVYQLPFPAISALRLAPCKHMLEIAKITVYTVGMIERFFSVAVDPIRI